jgi:hypothetical protein
LTSASVGSVQVSVAAAETMKAMRALSIRIMAVAGGCDLRRESSFSCVKLSDVED